MQEQSRDHIPTYSVALFSAYNLTHTTHNDFECNLRIITSKVFKACPNCSSTGRVQFVVVKNLRVLIYSKLHAKCNVITRKNIQAKIRLCFPFQCLYFVSWLANCCQSSKAFSSIICFKLFKPLQGIIECLYLISVMYRSTAVTTTRKLSLS